MSSFFPDFSRMKKIEHVRQIRDIGIGMLGYAFMGKAHTQAYIRMPFSIYPPPARPKLMVICGRNRKAVAESAKRYGFETYCTNWRELVGNPRVELVDNSLPNNMHAQPCVEAAEAGKHILCEKPLAMNAREASEMLEVAEKAHVKHMTGFNYRFLPAIQMTKKLVDEGYLGKILQYRAVYLQDWIIDPSVPLVWRLRRSIAGSGAVGDQGSHIIDLARYLVGEVSSVSAMTDIFIKERPLPEKPERKGKVGIDDAWAALVRFENGAIGSFETSRLCAGRKNYMRIELHGTEGSLVFNLERLNELEVCSRRDLEDRRGFKTIMLTENVHPYISNWWTPGHIIGWEHTFVHEVYHLIRCIEYDKSIAPLGATFHDGLKCQEIIDAILESSKTGKWESVPSQF